MTRALVAVVPLFATGCTAKSPTMTEPTAPPSTALPTVSMISVSGPEQAVAWVPAQIWTGATPPDLADDLGTRIELTVRSAARHAQTVRLHLDGIPGAA